MMYYMGPWMLIAGLLYVGFFVLIVLLIVRLLRGPRPWHMGGREGHEGHEGGRFGPPWAHPGNNALDILAERYAKGEIDEEEYKKRKENLMK